MHSIDENFLKSLTFTAEQLTILRTISEYQGSETSSRLNQKSIHLLKYFYFLGAYRSRIRSR